MLRARAAVFLVLISKAAAQGSNASLLRGPGIPSDPAMPNNASLDPAIMDDCAFHPCVRFNR